MKLFFFLYKIVLLAKNNKEMNLKLKLEANKFPTIEVFQPTKLLKLNCTN